MGKVPSILYFVVIPRLCAKSVLLVISPLPLIHAAISVNKDPVSIGFAVLPLSLINVPVGVGHSAFAIKLTIFSLAVERRSVWELYYSDALPLFLIFAKLSFVLSQRRLVLRALIRYRLEEIHPH